MIIVINGAPCSGKDTFCNFVASELIKKIGIGSCRIISTVDFVKEVAKFCGWDGKKTPKNRKFLSDLKDLLTEWNDGPYNDIYDYFHKCKKYWKECGYKEENCILFVMCREPKEIQKIVDRLGAKTLLVRREAVEETAQSNHADKEVFNYNYDITIVNNGTLDELNDVAITFCDSFLKGEI